MSQRKYRKRNCLATSIKTTVVSNASLLARPKEILKYIEQLNVSLHTLRPEIYKQIAQSNYPLQSVLNTIAVTRSQLPNLKIHLNYTVIKGMNDADEDFEALLGFETKHQTSWQFLLERNDEAAAVTRCPFNGKHTDLAPRDIFVDPNGTLYTSYGPQKQINTFEDIRERNTSGLISKINSLIL